MKLCTFDRFTGKIHRTSSQRLLLAVTLAGAAFMAGCEHASQSPLSPIVAGQGVTLRVQDIATSASTTDSLGASLSGQAPAAHGGPSITAAGNSSIVNGGTMAVTIASTTPFSTLYLFVGGKAVGLVAESPSPIAGYYEVRLPSARTSADLLLTFPQAVPLSEFELWFAAANPSGVVGDYVSLATRVTQVGTGDVQVTLSWDADSDVDLHVIDPAGEEIFYANRTASSGGTLDLDSNAGCAIDHVRNENITWPVGRAPVGHYTVRVDYWDSCGVGRTNFSVRVNAGGTPQIVSGTFTGSGDQGADGDGRTVATFERVTGPSAFSATPGVPQSPSTAGPRRTKSRVTP